MCSSSNCYVPFFNVYWIVYAILGVTFQLSLVYLIYKKSPATLDNLKVFLYNTASIQLSLIFFAFTSQHRILSNRTTCAILNMGPCRFISSTICFVNYHIYMAVNLATASAIAITVLFRFLTLVQKIVSANQTYFMVAATYVAPFIVLIIPFTDTWDFKVVQAASAREHPSYNFSIYPNFSGFAEIEGVPFISATIILTIGVYGIPFGCLFLTRKVLKLIRYHKRMSTKTKKQAETLIYGLIVQSMVPLVSYIPTFTCYIYIQVTGNEMLLNEHLILVSSALPGIVDPFISFYFIIPYRHAILELFFPRRKTTQIVNSATNISLSGAN
uniref:Uncharacterized protein n=1 Tax=Caenorhabditis japonica TaxID=281687 RepID=A0A8R1DZX7_CAEJA